MSLSWILVSVSLALLAGAGILWLRFGGQSSPKALPQRWPLISRRVFGSQELQMYERLREALPDHVLMSKLPLVRFCQPEDPGEVRYWYELLANQHVSFAICSTSGRVQAAIDIEGLRPSSRRSLKIKEAVLGACKVGYLRITPDKLPSVAELRALVPEAQSRSLPIQPRVSEAGEHLAATVAERRRERQSWADSNIMADSFFDDVAAEGTVSGFGEGRKGRPVAAGGLMGASSARAASATVTAGLSGLVVQELDVILDDSAAAVVVDTPAAPALRH